MIKALPPNTPEGARLLCEQPDIARLAEQFQDFTGVDVAQLASDFTVAINELLPDYGRTKATTLQALAMKSGKCGHRATAIEAVSAQLPNVQSALIIRDGHVANIIGSTVSRNVAIIDNGLRVVEHTRDDGTTYTTKHGDYNVNTAHITAGGIAKNEILVAGQLLLQMARTGKDVRAYDIRTHNEIKYYDVLHRYRRPKGVKVVLLSGLPALQYIAENYA